jgi:putative hydrolase of the HAD superfamily
VRAEPVLRTARASAVRLRDLDAVTLDANGTLVELADPVPTLQRLLADHGVARSPADVAAAVGREFTYYRAHMLEGRDPSTLAQLRRACTAIFLDALAARLDPDTLAPAYVGALRFELVAGARETLGALAARGLALAVVSNWDCDLPAHLERAGIAHLFAAILSSAEAGVAKPDTRIFELALERLQVEAARTLHVGDSTADEEGALAAGLQFASAPLAGAFEELV